MKTSRFGLKGAVKLAAFFVCGLMLLASVSAFRENPALGAALVAVPALFCAMVMFNSVRKSAWGLAFLVLGLGTLEIYLGAAKGMPVSWVLGGAGFVVFLVVRFVKAVAGAYNAAFPKGDLPFPKVSPMTHSFDSAFGNMRNRSDSSRPTINKTGLGEEGFNGRGGVHETFREDDPFGEFY